MRSVPRLHFEKHSSELGQRPPTQTYPRKRTQTLNTVPKLTVLNQFFPPDYAPTGQLLSELTTHLSQHGVRIRVFAGQPSYAFQATDAPTWETQGLVSIRRSRLASLWPTRIRGKAVNGLLYCIRAGLHLIRNMHQIDQILITTSPPFLPVLGYLANLLFGLSYVCLIYDLYPDVAIQLGVVSENHRISRLWRWINRQVWRRADGIIVLSSCMKERVTAHCPEVAEKVSVIHSWANPDVIVPREKVQNWFAMKHQLVEPFTVLYSGNMGRCHDAQTILEAMQMLKDEPIQFVFIGGGAKRVQLIEQANALGLTNGVFLPYQDKEDLPYSLTACDLSLVSVSPEAEGLVAPSKLYSALAAERPIAAICDRQSYLSSLIRDAECGATFTSGDSAGLAEFIRMLQATPSTAKQMGKQGRTYLQQHFTPARIAQQYHRVLFEGAVQSETFPPVSKSLTFLKGSS
ncbi:MAG: glycosyltransferase family 4 protein [Leptolyngbyaceae bacterium]|nr:glycosyltransferase family 4 protein [Leptolyngbyaceae bacterium]